MKILLVASFLPYPLFSGGQVRLYNIIKQLSKSHEVTLVCEKRANQTEKDIEEVKKICKEVYVIDRKKQWSPENILSAGFSVYPFLMTGHTLSSMKKVISDLLHKNRYDLIHVETFYIYQNVPETTVPVVLVEHNIEYSVYEKYAKTMAFYLKPILPLLYFDILKMKYWERKFWKKAKKLVAVSPLEKTQMGKDTALVPNGVDTTQFKLRRQKSGDSSQEKRILFIGDFKWIQNQDAATQILTEIWPDIKLKVKSEKSKVDLKLWIVGRQIPTIIRNLTKDPNVIFDENVDDTAEAFQKADILLAPIRIGGGTKFKILEAMASGVIVVTTSLGIEGIDAHHREEVLVGDTSSDLASLITEIVTDDTLGDKIKRQARTLIEKKYDWTMIVKELEKVYVGAVKS